MTASPSSLVPRRAALSVTAAVGLTACSRTASAQSLGTRPVGHVVLLGDSIFDNAGYLRGSGPDVVAQLRRQLPSGWQATLLARGGSVAAEVPGQLARLAPDATHLVVSAGGNDAGRRESVLAEPARSVADGLARIAALRESFEQDYQAMLDVLLKRGLPAAVCTVYDPRFPEPGRRRVAVVALAAFNDVITRGAFVQGTALIDLRLICSEDRDFAGPTGPSVRGGEKIAAAIANWAAGQRPRRGRSEVISGNESG